MWQNACYSLSSMCAATTAYGKEKQQIYQKTGSPKNNVFAARGQEWKKHMEVQKHKAFNCLKDDA